MLLPFCCATCSLESITFLGYVGVVAETHLPFYGVNFILGNNIVGGKVVPLPEVVPEPKLCPYDGANEPPMVFPACVICAQRLKLAYIDLSDTFMTTL